MVIKVGVSRGRHFRGRSTLADTNEAIDNECVVSGQ
jgi:hypothetical protein